jgi:hypothetical protein
MCESFYGCANRKVGAPWAIAASTQHGQRACDALKFSQVFFAHGRGKNATQRMPRYDRYNRQSHDSDRVIASGGGDEPQRHRHTEKCSQKTTDEPSAA